MRSGYLTLRQKSKVIVSTELQPLSTKSPIMMNLLSGRLPPFQKRFLTSQNWPWTSPAMLTGESTLTMLDYSARIPLTMLQRERTADSVMGLQLRADQYQAQMLMFNLRLFVNGTQALAINQQRGKQQARGNVQEGKVRGRRHHFCDDNMYGYSLLICMKTVHILLVVLLSLARCKKLTLSYIVEHELDQADNYVEVALTLTFLHLLCQGDIKEIRDVSRDYCLSQVKSKDEKKECANIVEVSKYQIQPKYINLRKILTFSSFFLSHNIVIEVQHTQGLGRLIDQILSAGRNSLLLEEISWKAHKEQDPQRSAIREGMTQGEQLCRTFGKRLKQVLSIFELEHEEEEEEDDRDQDLAQEEIQYSTMRFKVKCDDPSP